MSALKIQKLSAPSFSGLHAGAVTQIIAQAASKRLPFTAAQCGMLQAEAVARINGRVMSAMTRDAKVALTCGNKVSNPSCSCSPAVVDIVLDDNRLSISAIDELLLNAAKRIGQSICSQGAVPHGCASPACLSGTFLYYLPCILSLSPLSTLAPPVSSFKRHLLWFTTVHNLVQGKDSFSEEEDSSLACMYS